MVREMADLGFNRIELSHGVRITLVPGILRALEEGIVSVSSTHNFCPLPTGIQQAAPNLFQPSTSDQLEHDSWLRHTKRSLDFAAQVGATVLVCHLGSVEFLFLHPGVRLAAYAKRHAQADLSNHKGYLSRLEKAREKLSRRVAPFWQRTVDSVSEVLDYAKERGVRIGVENREKLGELPLDEEITKYFSELPPGSSAGYWHDTGHAEIKQSMGLINHRGHLTSLSPRIIGFHLHDVNADGQDHQAVGTGKVDFSMISEFWRPDHVLVLELSPRVSPTGVRNSLERLNALAATSRLNPSKA
jgi:sugar phosphate isomerase/epimerase